MSIKTLVVIGGGAAGHQIAHDLRDKAVGLSTDAATASFEPNSQVRG